MGLQLPDVRLSNRQRNAPPALGWQNLKVIQKKCVNALNILDRFHIAKKFNEAFDQVRRNEVNELKDAGYENVLYFVKAS